VKSRHRRDFLLDSTGVSALAGNRNLLVAYIDIIAQRFDGALLIPVPVLTEARSGHRRTDVLIDRLIKTIGGPEGAYVVHTPGVASRTGVLRTEALEAGAKEISAIDAQVVAARSLEQPGQDPPQAGAQLHIRRPAQLVSRPGHVQTAAPDLARALGLDVWKPAAGVGIGGLAFALAAPELARSRLPGTVAGNVVSGDTSSQQASNGGAVYTFDLIKGLRYSNGRPVRAADFAWAVERAIRLSPAASPRRSLGSSPMTTTAGW